LVHEMGHNMGCAHDRANYTLCNESSPDWNCPAYSYSYGYGISGIFGTIMSYISPRINYFSTPNKTYSGYAIGIAAGSPSAADCVSTFNNTTPIIAQFQLGTATTSISAPTGFSATASGTTVSLTWNAVSGAAGYKLYYGTTSGTYSGSTDLGNVTAQSISGVSPGTYYLALTAYTSSSSESAKSTETNVTTSLLSAPTGLSATASGTTVSLTWSAVSGAAGYKLYYGTTSSSYSGSTDLGNVTSKSFSGLSPGTYYLAIAAYDSSSFESAKSTKTSVTVSFSAPTGFSATASGTTVSLTWSAVSGAAGYKLYYGTTSGSYLGSTDLGNVTSKSFSGVSPGTYYLSIAAYDSSSFESAKSTETSVIIP